MNASSDLIGLLKLIQISMYNRQTKKNHIHSLHDAYDAFYQFRQGKRMSTHEYLESFKDLVSVIEHWGGQIGLESSRVQQHLAEMGVNKLPTSNQLTMAQEKCQQQYLGTAFLLKSDPSRFKTLQHTIENEYTRNINTYPKTCRHFFCSRHIETLKLSVLRRQ